MLYLHSPSESSQNWGPINPNVNNYHSDPTEIGSKLWLLDITEWWWQQEDMHSKYAGLTNVAHDIFSIIPHRVRVEASISLGRYVIWCRKSKSTGETLHKTVIVKLFAQGNI
jgi:hypothetical protein